MSETNAPPTPGPQPAAPAIRDPRRWIILSVLCLATLVLVIDNMVLTVAIPPMAEDLHASAEDIQWVIAAYILVFAGLLLTAGSLSDRFGRRRILIIGLFFFGAASVFATLSSNPGELIAARVVMGLGGSLVMPSTLSIIMNLFDEQELRKAMAAWSSVAMLGLVCGPLLGGVLIAHFWWGSVFVVNIPIVALSLLAAVTLMPESKGPWRKPDPLGAVLSAVGLVALVWGIIKFPAEGFFAANTLGAFVVAVVALSGFVIWEARTEVPMVPLFLFRDRNFAGGCFSLTLVQVGNGGLLLVLTQYLQFVLGYTPLKAGLAFIPLAVAALIFNGVSAGAGAKIGNKQLAIIGLAVMAVGFVLMAGLKVDGGFTLPAIGMFILGAGAGLGMPAAIAALMGAVPPEQAGVGSALNDTVQQMGAALGVAILGSVVTSRFTANMPASAPAEAKHSVADAFAVAVRSADPSGLIASARDAYTSAMSVAFVAGAAGVLGAALLTFFVMKGGKPTAAAGAGADVSAAAGVIAVTDVDLDAAVDADAASGTEDQDPDEDRRDLAVAAGHVES